MTAPPDTHREALLTCLAALNPDAILYEPRKAFDRAIVGLAHRPSDRWQGNRPDEGRWVAVYSYERAVNELARLEKVTDPDRLDQLAEHVSYNSMGGWYGADTPAWIDDFDEECPLLGRFIFMPVGESYEMT